jgi:hypothetical protein
MSEAASTFATPIADAESFPKLFGQTHKNNAAAAEVLKRAELVMALTAWETYVEDRLNEAVETKLKVLSGKPRWQICWRQTCRRTQKAAQSDS